ncbi:MAG: hypothetical protein Q8Q17_01025 [bacterium]|nr:hypothetical protein [bacterium]
MNIVSLYEFFKIIFIILDIILFVFVIFLIVKSWRFRPKFVMSPEGEKTYTLGTTILKERWESIISRSKINSSESIKASIIDADNLVDDILKRMGLEGESMVERMEKLSAGDFVTINQLLAAHHVRNRLVHEPGFSVSHEEANKVLQNYGSFLSEIGAI